MNIVMVFFNIMSIHSNDKELIMDEDELKYPEWKDMIMLKRYKYFTRFLKKCDNGYSYTVCFQNTDLDAWETRNE